MTHPYAALFDANFVGPVGRVLGAEFRSWDETDQELHLDFSVNVSWSNGLGSIQGGIVCAMLDLCCTAAGVCASGASLLMPTIELKTSFVAPARAGLLKGIGRALHLGRRVAFLEGRLLDPTGRLLATATATAAPTPRQGQGIQR
jgi:uncharacterized protein (TIGR00369 family)